MAKTWSRPGPLDAKVVCSDGTGTEAAPTLATEGLALDGADEISGGFGYYGEVAGYGLVVETAGSLTAGTSIIAYVYNPVTSNWLRAPQLDWVLTGGGGAGVGEASPGYSIPASQGRVAYIPNGIGAASSVYINGVPRGRP